MFRGTVAPWEGAVNDRGMAVSHMLTTMPLALATMGIAGAVARVPMVSEGQDSD